MITNYALNSVLWKKVSYFGLKLNNIMQQIRQSFFCLTVFSCVSGKSSSMYINTAYRIWKDASHNLYYSDFKYCVKAAFLSSYSGTQVLFSVLLNKELWKYLKIGWSFWNTYFWVSGNWNISTTQSTKLEFEIQQYWKSLQILNKTKEINIS